MALRTWGNTVYRCRLQKINRDRVHIQFITASKMAHPCVVHVRFVSPSRVLLTIRRCIHCTHTRDSWEASLERTNGRSSGKDLREQLMASEESVCARCIQPYTCVQRAGLISDDSRILKNSTIALTMSDVSETRRIWQLLMIVRWCFMRYRIRMMVDFVPSTRSAQHSLWTFSY